jgi:hypothetical protein
VEGRPRVLTSAPSSGRGLSTGAVLVPLIALFLGVVAGVVLGGRQAGDGGHAGGGSSPPLESKAGAAATAVADVQRLSVDVVLDRQLREQTLGEIGTPSYAERESAELDEARTGRGGQLLQEASSTGGVFAQTTPLAYSVTSYAAGRAVVRVWNVTVIAGGRVDPGAQFNTDEYTLVWSDDRWLIDASSLVHTGPTPDVLKREVTAQPSQLIAALDGYKEVSGEAP